MNGSLIAIIVILVLCLVLAGIIYYTYCRIREKLRDTSRMLFGTDSMIEGMKQREAEVEMTPKSVSSATNLYMPSIMRDFPEFHYDEMKSRAENVLTSYLQSITGQNPALLSEGTKELKEQLRLRLEMLQNQSQRESFEYTYSQNRDTSVPEAEGKTEYCPAVSRRIYPCVERKR